MYEEGARRKVNKSDFMELVAELSTLIVVQRFGEDTFVDTDEGTVFGDDPQDYFNEQYDVVESMIINALKIEVDEDRF